MRAHIHRKKQCLERPISRRRRFLCASRLAASASPRINHRSLNLDGNMEQGSALNAEAAPFVFSVCKRPVKRRAKHDERTRVRVKSCEEEET